MTAIQVLESKKLKPVNVVYFIDLNNLSANETVILEKATFGSHLRLAVVAFFIIQLFLCFLCLLLIKLIKML